MDYQTRRSLYQRAGRRITPAQRRRLIKKAGRESGAVIERDNGMGYPPAMQGYRELVGFEHGTTR